MKLCFVNVDIIRIELALVKFMIGSSERMDESRVIDIQNR